MERDGKVTMTTIEKNTPEDKKFAENLCTRLIGMEKAAATDLIWGLSYRSFIRMEDGVPKVGTRDFRTDRVKLTIEKGFVVEAIIG